MARITDEKYDAVNICLKKVYDKISIPDYSFQKRKIKILALYRDIDDWLRYYLPYYFYHHIEHYWGKSTIIIF